MYIVLLQSQHEQEKQRKDYIYIDILLTMSSPEASNQMDDDVSTKTNIGEDEMVTTEDNNNNSADYSSKIQEEVTNNNNNETSKEDNDAIAEWEASAKMIAEKVQRQQEGKETAMLPKEHEDESFLTVDEIAKLLDAQLADNAGSKSKFGFSSRASNSKEEKEMLANWFLERSKYIPLRLSYEERKYLRLVKATMNGAEYTDLVDGKTHKSEQRRQNEIVRCIGATLTGLVTALKHSVGQKLAENRNFSKYSASIQSIFEITRRYKIMNPEKMRTAYGKMLYLLQDSNSEAIQQALEMTCVKPIKNVYDTLEEFEALDILRDPYVATATMEILPEKKTRNQIQREIAMKNKAKKYICRKYEKRGLDRDTIENCLNSICDNNNYLNSNRKPVDRMIYYLQKFFNPKTTGNDDPFSLAITTGDGEARLTHSHERQFNYVLQSLTLWREIVNDMFRLWCSAEQDLLDENCKYVLRDTGQGKQRVQVANRTSKAMHGILYAVQQRNGNCDDGWVGSSVIHLGDNNVPNALMFIDKYNQVCKILNPIDQALRYVDINMEDDGLKQYIKSTYGSAEKAKITVLCDFFKGAFDGSGGDNFFEAGSCIDGRLTSAWNWCQQLPQKDFFPLFRLSGFLGFDGREFQE